MTRFDILKSEEMSDEQRALTEENQAAGGRLRGGPYWAYLYDPELMRKQMALNDHIRDCSLDKRARQIAIMTTVRFWNSEYPRGRPGPPVARTRRRCSCHRRHQSRRTAQARRFARGHGL